MSEKREKRPFIWPEIVRYGTLEQITMQSFETGGGGDDLPNSNVTAVILAGVVNNDNGSGFRAEY